MSFILGILVGVVAEGLILIILALYRTPIERTVSQTLVIPKGKIIEPENADITQWVEDLDEE